SIPFSLLGLGIVQVASSAQADPDVQSTSFLIYSVLLALLLVTGPNPIAAGIHLWANRLVKEERVEFSLFWQGLRTYWRPAAVLFFGGFIVFVLLAFQMAFYFTREEPLLRLVTAIWVNVALIWMAMQGYMLPLLIEQTEKRLMLVIRNAFFI